MRKQITAMVLTSAMLFGTVGCIKRTQVEPPQVVFERGLIGATDATAIVANGLKLVNNARITLTEQGELTEDQSKALFDVLVAIAEKNQAAIEAIRLADTGAQSDWKKAILDVVAEAKNLDPVLIAIKNPDAQATLKTALATLEAVLKVILTTYGGQQ